MQHRALAWPLLATCLAACASPAPAGPEPVPKPAIQGAVPVPTDSDRDGVPNAVDACPGTPPGMGVDGAGCVRVDAVVLGAGTFDPGSAVVKPAALDALRAVALALVAAPRLVVEVRGHADARGDPARNQALSRRRAEAVRDLLVAAGVEARRLSVVGAGAREPADTNDTEAGRANNRRVGFRVLAGGG